MIEVEITKQAADFYDGFERETVSNAMWCAGDMQIEIEELLLQRNYNTDLLTKNDWVAFLAALVRIH